MTRRAFIGGDAVLDGVIRRADLVVDKGRIEAIIEEGAPPSVGGSKDRTDVVDCTGRLIAPGFIDLQCNGAGGVDLTTDPHRIVDVASTLTRFGVTTFLPTVVTSPESTRRGALQAMQALVAGHRAPGDGARPLGLHFEGPRISPDHLGAHVEKFTSTPAAEELDDWIDSGCVSLVTVAPETEGAMAMIEQLAAGGVVVSAGHTAMTPSDFDDARLAGVTYVTHLFNAMAQFNHRAPGPIGAALADDGATVGIICDGIHVDPVAVRMAWNALGPARLSLVSDASAPLGAPFGTFRLGNFEVTYDDTGVRTSDGTLAGSALALDQAVRNLVTFTRCPLVDAIATVTTTPADLLGLTDRGRLALGSLADLTILDGDGALVATIVGGRTEWTA